MSDMLPGLREHAQDVERRERERRETGWKAEVGPKVAAPLIVVAVLAALAWLSGVSSLPAMVQGQSARIVTVENKVDVLERNEIRTEERQNQIIEKLNEVKDEIVRLRGRREPDERRR